MKFSLRSSPFLLRFFGFGLVQMLTLACLMGAEPHSALSKDGKLMIAAFDTYTAYVKKMGRNRSNGEDRISDSGASALKPDVFAARGRPKFEERIPEEFWKPAIRELKPIKVVVHHFHLVLVQKVSAEQEEGLYVVNPSSSDAPVDGRDGYRLTPNPMRVEGEGAASGVFSFVRRLK